MVYCKAVRSAILATVWLLVDLGVTRLIAWGTVR